MKVRAFPLLGAPKENYRKTDGFMHQKHELKMTIKKGRKNTFLRALILTTVSISTKSRLSVCLFAARESNSSRLFFSSVKFERFLILGNFRKFSSPAFYFLFFK